MLHELYVSVKYKLENYIHSYSNEQCNFFNSKKLHTVINNGNCIDCKYIENKLKKGIK
jgi:hypothetical protein